MSQDIKESIIMAGVITAIIAILGIIFGNTGSGFFRNLNRDVQDFISKSTTECERR